MATITDARQLGAAVRAERRRRKLTQEALAERAGVSRAWLAKFETGHRAASVEQVFLVLRTLGFGLELTAPRMTKAEADLLSALTERGEQ